MGGAKALPASGRQTTRRIRCPRGRPGPWPVRRRRQGRRSRRLRIVRPGPCPAGRLREKQASMSSMLSSSPGPLVVSDVAVTAMAGYSRNVSRVAVANSIRHVSQSSDGGFHPGMGHSIDPVQQLLHEAFLAVEMPVNRRRVNVEFLPEVAVGQRQRVRARGNAQCCLDKNIAVKGGLGAPCL